ncbi:MAG: zinc transporter permease [Actinomycetota bacterium]|nr:zinc transporter permease [Actinomycetota bacterium]MDH5225287.1 zinc transporter permease [Actinomycetota bacterium]MDH5312708.1 zinc transporter permease [Actinomycetota bacterium]
MPMMPPSMWENPDAYQPREVAEAEEGLHRHDDECGHEAIEHDGHTDYVHEGKRHWWNGHRWEAH